MDEINTIIQSGKPSASKNHALLSTEKKDPQQNLDNVPQSTKLRHVSQVPAAQRSVQSVSKKENYSEIKNKISIFSLNHFQSPSEAHPRHSPSLDRQQTMTQSEFMKQYASSPDSLMGGSQLGYGFPLSVTKCQQEKASVYTQDCNNNKESPF